MKNVLSPHVSLCYHCALINSPKLLPSYQKWWNCNSIPKRPCSTQATQAANESNTANNPETAQNPVLSNAGKTGRKKSKSNKPVIGKEQTKSSKISHSKKLTNFFENHPYIMTIKSLIPKKYLLLHKKLTPPDILYLIDPRIAEASVKLILPRIKDNKNQMVCETNAGLGMIAKNLLDNGVKLVRMYEPCSEFRDRLDKLSLEIYPGRAEVFKKNIYHLPRYEYLDKMDQGGRVQGVPVKDWSDGFPTGRHCSVDEKDPKSRVQELLLGVPKKQWNDDPAMTIIGPMPDNKFISYVLKSLPLQSYLVTLGRIEIYAFMKPRDYVIFTAGPENDLHTYQATSVLCSLFFDVELLEKFPRKAFFPWEAKKVLSNKSRYYDTVDTDSMYLVRMTLKKQLPVSREHLLHLLVFVRLSFNKGPARVNRRIIPHLEEWIPGVGLNIIVPRLKHPDYYSPGIGIYTKFGELKPHQILHVFQEMVNHPGYPNSPFLKITEKYLTKSVTTSTDVNDRFLELEQATVHEDE